MQDPKKRDLIIFGLIWSILFSVVTYLYRDNEYVFTTFLTLAILGFLVTAISPNWLVFLYKKWVFFGMFVGKINSYIILCVLFYGLITPIALFFKVIGRDALHQKMDKKKTTYWVTKEQQPMSMRYQF